MKKVKEAHFPESSFKKKVQIRFFVLKEACSRIIYSSANRLSPVPKFFEEEKKKQARQLL